MSTFVFMGGATKAKAVCDVTRDGLCNVEGKLKKRSNRFLKPTAA